MNNWRSLNQTLNSLNEEQVKALLDDEIVGHPAGRSGTR